MDKLSTGLATLTNLTKVNMSFTRCNLERRMSPARARPSHKPTKVDVSFARYNQITYVDELGMGLAKLTSVTKVDWSSRVAT